MILSSSKDIFVFHSYACEMLQHKYEETGENYKYINSHQPTRTLVLCNAMQWQLDCRLDWFAPIPLFLFAVFILYRFVDIQLAAWDFTVCSRLILLQEYNFVDNFNIPFHLFKCEAVWNNGWKKEK